MVMLWLLVHKTICRVGKELLPDPVCLVPHHH
jgi:hypothetical protein